MDFTDGLQKLALIPRSHFQHCNSRGAPQRSLTKEGLQSPGSTHVKYCAQHQRQEGHVYRDRTGSYKAGAVEGQRPTSHTSPHGRNNVQLALCRITRWALGLSSISALSVVTGREGGDHPHFCFNTEK